MRNPLRSLAFSGSPHSSMFGQFSTRLGLIFVFLCASVLTFELLLLKRLTKTSWRPGEFSTHLFGNFHWCQMFSSTNVLMCHHLAQSIESTASTGSGFCWLLLSFKFFSQTRRLLPQLLGGGRSLVLAEPLNLESLVRMGAILLVMEVLAGSCSVFYKPDEPGRNSWRCPAALARGGHRREPQHTGRRTPLSSLAVQAHSVRDVGLHLQAFIQYEASPVSSPLFQPTGLATVQLGFFCDRK